jgi:hypothetical protein
MPAYWKTGVLTVPGSTGTVAVTGLGATPAAVFFYGTNWLTEDSAVTSSGTGLFRGMAAPDYSNPSSILQSAAAVIPAGDAHVTDTGLAIRMMDTSGTFSNYLYYASVTSFDADGFTLNWGLVTAGGNKVVYVALMDVDNVGSFIGTTSQSGLAFGFKAGASLLHGAWGGPGVGGSDRTQEFYAGGAYPGASSVGWFSAGMTVFTFPTSASAQYMLELTLDSPSIRIASGGHFTGPFLIPSDIVAAPTGGGQTDLSFNGDSADGGMIVAWDDEDSETGAATPPANTGNTTTVSGLPFPPGLVIGYSISDEPDGQGTGGRGAAGFSVATADFQWSAVVDGVDRGAFQSFQRGFTDCVHNTDVHAGTIELTTDGFIMTTEEDSASAGSWIWHAFGHPAPFLWIPHIYRRVFGDGGGGKAPPPVPAGDILLEDGDNILLEDGTGVLLLE